MAIPIPGTRLAALRPSPALLAETKRLDIPSYAAKEGAYLLSRFKTLMETQESIGNVRGKGLMMAIEFVADRKTKQPAGKNFMSELGDRIYEAGALVRIVGHSILMSPPLILTRKDSDEIADAVEAGLSQTRLSPAN